MLDSSLQLGEIPLFGKNYSTTKGILKIPISAYVP